MKKVISILVLVLSVVTISGCGTTSPTDINSDGFVADEMTSDTTVQDTVSHDVGDTMTATDSGDTTDSLTTDTPIDTTPVPRPCQEGLSGPIIKVTTYNDNNDSSLTSFAQSFKDDDTPLPGVAVSQIEPFTGAGFTCDEGWYSFVSDGEGAFTDGYRILKIDAPDCKITSHNMARRTPIALAEGKLKMVIMGDSIPRRGGPIYFFDNLQTWLGGFGEITIKNHAVAGSVSTDWMPETSYFGYIEPELPDADIVFITIGGNDIMDYVRYHQNLPLDQLMAGITTTITTVESNIETIYNEVRRLKPDADIIWLIYPNYAMSDLWADATGNFAEVVAQYFQTEMEKLLRWAAGIDGLILVDLFSRMNKADLDLSLWDELHYNNYGHVILAEEIFKVLNGVIIKDGVPTIGGDRMIGVYCN